MRFIWHEPKRQANLKKHGVDFADAVGVLFDELAITIVDENPAEERFISIGVDPLNRILVVAYTWRGDTIRIISARKATAAERKGYIERWAR